MKGDANADAEADVQVVRAADELDLQAERGGIRADLLPLLVLLLVEEELGVRLTEGIVEPAAGVSEGGGALPCEPLDLWPRLSPGRQVDRLRGGVEVGREAAAFCVPYGGEPPAPQPAGKKFDEEAGDA